MRNSLFILFISATMVSFSQTKESKTKPENKTQAASKGAGTFSEIKISRESLMKAKTIRDIITEIPADCKIYNYEFASTAKKGRMLNSNLVNGDVDIQKRIDTKRCMTIYVQIKSSCPDLHKWGYAIKVE